MKNLGNHIRMSFFILTFVAYLESAPFYINKENSIIMKKLISAMAIGALVLTSCNNNSTNNPATDDTDSTAVEGSLSAASEAQTLPELTDERFQELVGAIPEHTMLTNPESTLTKEYYDAFMSAVELPSGGLGDIGNDEWLYYFVCGNDPCESHKGELLSSDVKGDTLYVKFNIIHTIEGRDKEPHNFKLVAQNGELVIADYDGTLAQLKDYILEQRDYLRSDEFKKTAKAILDNPDNEEFYKEAVRKELNEVKEYFKLHP